MIPLLEIMISLAALWLASREFGRAKERSRKRIETPPGTIKQPRHQHGVSSREPHPDFNRNESGNSLSKKDYKTYSHLKYTLRAQSFDYQENARDITQGSKFTSAHNNKDLPTASVTRPYINPNADGPKIVKLSEHRKRA